MKKILYFVAAAFVFGSCQQDKIVDNASQSLSDEGYMIGASVQNGTHARVTIDGYKVKWAASDVITVFNELGEKVDCQLKSGSEGSTEGIFMSTMNPDEIVYSVFPATSTPVMSENLDSIRLALPAVYTVDDNSLNAPMYGEFDFVLNKIKFSYLTAMLKVKITGLPEGFNTIKFKGNNSLCGVYRLAIPATDASLELDSKGSSEVKVTRADNAGEFYLPLPEGKYGELSISALDAQNREIQIVTLFNQKYERGRLYSLNRAYEPGLITEPVEFVTGHPTKGTHVDGWTKHISFDQHATLTMEENTDPSFLWSKSIKVVHNDGDTWNHSFAFNFDNTKGIIKPKLYKLSFKIKTGMKMGWKVMNLVDKTNTDKKDDSFEFILNGDMKSQVWQSVTAKDDFEEVSVYVNFANNQISGWGGSVTYRPTAGTTLMDHITLMFRNPGSGANTTTIISDVQLSEVVQ